MLEIIPVYYLGNQYLLCKKFPVEFFFTAILLVGDQKEILPCPSRYTAKQTLFYIIYH